MTLPHGVLLRLAYDGTGFRGWASQREQRTVADALRGAILAVDDRAEGPRGSSRTDSGVHAEGQAVAFDTRRELAPRSWVLALNQHLPDDVAVRSARAVPPGFEPRFSAAWKRYRYRLLADPVRDPLERTRAWRIGGALDVERMRAEAQALLGTHDFAAFRSAGDEREITVRTLTRVDVEVRSDRRDQPGEQGRFIDVVVEGSAFLYNMVRILTGTLVEVGLGRKPPGTVARAFETLDRGVLGMTAPAQGLTLEHVELKLPDDCGEPWPP